MYVPIVLTSTVSPPIMTLSEYAGSLSVTVAWSFAAQRKRLYSIIHFKQKGKILKEFVDAYHQLDESKLVREGKIKRKMTDHTHLILSVSDDMAYVVFPDKGTGISDPGTMFFGDNIPEFQEWCEELFEYMWMQSNTFIESEVFPKLR